VSYGVVLFDSTSAALRAEKVLKQAGLEIKLIPVPRQLSSDCGICIRFNWSEAAAVEAALQEKRVPLAGVYCLDKNSP